MKISLFRSPLVVVALACATAGVSSAKPANAVPQPVRLAKADAGLQTNSIPMEDDVALTPREIIELKQICSELCNNATYEGGWFDRELARKRCFFDCVKGYKDLGFQEAEASSNDLDHAVLEDAPVLSVEAG